MQRNTHKHSLSLVRTHIQSERKKEKHESKINNKKCLLIVSNEVRIHAMCLACWLWMISCRVFCVCVLFLFWFFMAYKRSEVTLFYCLPNCEYATGIFYAVNWCQKIAHYLFIQLKNFPFTRHESEDVALVSQIFINCLVI